MKRVDGLIRHGRIFTMNAESAVIEDGAIAFDKGRIVEVGPTSDLTGRIVGGINVDAMGAVVRPGFIDAHIHVSQYTARSALPMMGKGPLNMGHWKGEIRPEDERASAMLAALDYLACGYTGFVDPGTIFEPDAVAPVADEIGIRVWLTDPYVADRGRELANTSPELVSGGFLARWPTSMDEAAARVGTQLKRNDNEGLTRAFIGLYGETTESDALRSHAIRVARDAGVQFQMHLGYTPAGYRALTSEMGKTPLQAIDEREGLRSDQTYIHMNLVDDADAALIAARRPALVWCPYGTLQMIGAGGARNRMVELERDGAVVALATDIPRAVNFDGLASLAVGCAVACGTPLDPWRLLFMRTRHAAASVGAGDMCGSLVPGLSADIVIEEPHALDIMPAWESSVLSGQRQTRHVFVAGRHVFKSGEWMTVDSERIRFDARKSAQGILSRILN